MTISLFGAVAALLLLAIPLYSFYALGIRFSSQLLVAVCRMLAGLIFMAGMMKLAIIADSIVATIGLSLLLILLATWLTVVRSKRELRSMFLPTLCGIAASVILTSTFFIWIVVSSDHKLSPSILISIVGLTAGGCIMPVSEAFSVYYAGLRHHAQLFNLLIGNGATCDQAQNYLLRRALQKASVPSIKYIGGMMITSQPLLMWTMIIQEAPLGTAVAWQASMTIAIMSASIAAIMISLLLARRLSVDEYSRIK